MAGEDEVDSFHLPVSLVLRQGVLPTALPFVACSGGYFFGLLRMSSDLSPEQMCALKCAPILLLASFALIRGRPSYDKFWAVAGLLLSAVGDFYLVWDDEENFMKGMAAFAMAHVFYVLSYGFRSFAPVVLMATSLMAFAATRPLLSHLDGPLYTPIAGYIIIITIMFWRSIARLSTSRNWPNVAGVVGTTLFLLSDLNLSYNAFYFSKPHPYAQLITMLTYYGGQLGIALSVMDRRRLVTMAKKTA